MRILAFVLSLLACGPAHAASLRTMTTLHGPNVYLRDLFGDAGVNASRMLGPGPEPGGRIIVEAPQLSAIARQYDVAWRPLSPGDRAVLAWPGRPMRRREAIDAVRAAITAAGASSDIDIDLPGFSPPTVPADAAPVATVSQLDYDRGTGRFTADLTVTGGGMHPIDTRIGGRAEEMVQAPVALTRLLADTVLRADDIRIARVRTSLLQNNVARSADQIVGMQLRQPVAEGQPLRLADLVRPPLVQKGATVQVQLTAAGLTVTGLALALDAGAEGQMIRVQNMTSRAFLLARVVAPGQVSVIPGAAAAQSMIPSRLDRQSGQ